MKKELNPQQMANRVFNVFLKGLEDDKIFRDALRSFIEAIEAKENEWMLKNFRS